MENMKDKVYVLKADTRIAQYHPKPEDIENWIELEHDGSSLLRKKYDIANGVWIDAEKTEEQLLAEFKNQREISVSNITVEVDGMVFDGDEESTTRMLKPLAALENESDTQLWVLHDNTVAYPTKAQIREALRLAGIEQTNMWVR